MVNHQAQITMLKRPPSAQKINSLQHAGLTTTVSAINNINSRVAIQLQAFDVSYLMYIYALKIHVRSFFGPIASGLPTLEAHWHDNINGAAIDCAANQRATIGI